MRLIPSGSGAPSRLALTLASGLFSTLTFAQAPAPAQDAADEVTEVVITGSRIQRADASSVGPLTTLTAADIEAAAPTSAGDLLQALPSVGVSLNSNGTQGTSFGVSSINLRYLGSAEGSGNRTLVLVDGHRWVNAVGGRGFRDFVDLNTIPLGIIERIEVLKDGASAIYGADAIAGVVNIHTRQSVEGFEASGRYGITDRGDNQNVSGFVNWGTQGDKASVLLSLSYNDTEPLLTEDRALTLRALVPVTAPPTSPRGLYVLPGLANNAFFGTPAAFANNAANAITRLPGVTSIGAGGAADEAFRVAGLPGDDFNTQAQGIYAIGPSERVGAFARFGWTFNDDLSMRAEALYNKRESSQLFSPVLLDIRGSNGFSIANNQAFNPFGTANGVPLANASGLQRHRVPHPARGHRSRQSRQRAGNRHRAPCRGLRRTRRAGRRMALGCVCILVAQRSGVQRVQPDQQRKHLPGVAVTGSVRRCARLHAARHLRYPDAADGRLHTL
jgi:iron complex outermembrane recepter protein